MTAAGSSGGGAIEVKCKRWSCDFCRDSRRAGVIRQILNGNPNRMLTLTHQHRPGDTPEAIARAIAKAFPKLMRLCRKKCGDAELAYFAVFEAHETGFPHLHVALRSPYLHQGWLKRVWYKLTRSYIVDIRAIDGAHRTAGYMSKYLGKDLHRFGSLKRYWQSANYQTEEQKVFERTFPSVWKWERCDQSLAQVETEWRRLGRKPYDIGPGMKAWGTWIPQLEEYAAASPVERRVMRAPRGPPVRLIDQSWRGLCD